MLSAIDRNHWPPSIGITGRFRRNPQHTHASLLIDEGVDIVAHKDELGFEPPIIKVQVKSGEGTLGDPVVAGERAVFAPVANLVPRLFEIDLARTEVRLEDLLQ